MNDRRSLLSLFCFVVSLGLLAVTMLAVAGSALAQPTTRHVATSGVDTGDCADPANPCQTIQYAVDQASGGDLVKIATGVYTDVQTQGSLSQVVYLTKTLTLQGGYTTTAFVDPPDPSAYPTTLDAGGQGRVVYISGGPGPGETISPTLEGLRLTGGDADRGAGLYAITATLTLSASQAFSNAASISGGGLYLNGGSHLLAGNVVRDNSAGAGAGVYLQNSPGTTIVDNRVISNTAGSLGGGLAISSSTARLDRNWIMGNSAGTNGGGGLALSTAGATLTNNVLADNLAGAGGSGVWLLGGSTISATHNTLARNGGTAGTGISLDASPNTATLTNTILVSHSVGIDVQAGSAITLGYTLWGTATWANITDWTGLGTIVTGTNNVRGDPAFVNPAAADYHIDQDSAAIDAGADAGVTDDIDREPRPAGAAPDLGADEYQPFVPAVTLYLPMIFRDDAN